MNIVVNGTNRAVESPPLTPLLHVLREELDVLSPKAGCENGGCGACTVLVDGAPRRSCLTAVGSIDGAEVTTVEGLGTPEAMSAVQQAFVHYCAAQCGFCTPGMIMSALDLANRNSAPSEQEVREWLEGNICRCTGYHNIVKAVMAGAGAMGGGS